MGNREAVVYAIHLSPVQSVSFHNIKHSKVLMSYFTVLDCMVEYFYIPL